MVGEDKLEKNVKKVKKAIGGWATHVEKDKKAVGGWHHHVGNKRRPGQRGCKAQAALWQPVGLPMDGAIPDGRIIGDLHVTINC